MPPIVVASLVVLLEGLAVSATFPVVHVYCAEFGAGPIWIGLLFALVAGPKVFLNPVWGHFSDRIGRRPVLMICTLGTIAGSLGWALAPSLLWLALSRVCVGIFGAQAVLASAIAADVSTPQRRAASMAMLGVAFGIALTVGPLIGGMIARHVSFAAVGWFCGSTQLLSLIVIFAALRETRPANRDPSAEVASNTTGLLHRRQVLLLLIVTLLMTVGVSELTSTFGVFSQKLYSFDAAQTSYAFAVLGLLGALVQGGMVRPLVARFGDKPITAAGLGLLVGGFAVFASQPPLVGLFAGTVLIAIGTALAMPCLTAMLSKQVDESEQGGVLGWSQSATGLGRASGFLLGGWLFEMRGAVLVYGTAALLAAIGLMVLAPARRERAETQVS